MSFAYDVKSELCGVENDGDGRFAQLYGLLLFGRSFGPGGISLQTEHPDVALAIRRLMRELYGIETCVRAENSRAQILSVEDREQVRRVWHSFGYDEKTVSLRINLGCLDFDACAPAFVRGVFLSCGSVVDPGKDYHLEFVTPHIHLARDLTALLRARDFSPKAGTRKGNRVVYFKDSGQIEDMLTFMGAARQSLELMNVKVYKDLRNKANRVTNCETANIEKMVNASAAQVEAIRKLAAARMLGELPDDLREVAAVRLENPDASLRELGALLSTPLSRSGVNHRLGRLMELAKNM